MSPDMADQNTITEMAAKYAAGSSLYDLQREYGRRAQTIWRWLAKRGVSFRPSRPTNYVDLTPSLVEFLDGELLGDGSFGMASPSGPSAYFSRASKHATYIGWMASTLALLGITPTHIGSHGMNDGTGKKHQATIYKSKSYRSLLLLRTRWYRDGKKLLPGDVVISPTSVRQWYIGDGYLDKKSQHIVMSTNSFRKDEVETLCDLLCQEIDGLECWSIPAGQKHHPGQYLVWVRRSSVPLFLDYIGRCPCPLEQLYGYKWDARPYTRPR